MDQVRKNEISAVVLFAASLFLFLSIFTFNGQDLSFYTSDPNLVSQNATGVVGAYIGGVLLFFMGKAAYVIPLLTLVWGISRLVQMESRRVSLKIFGTIILVAAVSAILSMLVDSSRTIAFAWGGVMGTLVSGFLLEYLGRVGAMVFIIAMIVLSVLIATEFLILPIFVTAVKFLAKIPSRVRSALPEGSAVSPGGIIPGRGRLRAAREEIARKLETMKRQVETVRDNSLAKKTAGKQKLEPEQAVTDEPKIIAQPKPQKAAAIPVRVTGVSDGSTGEKIDYKLPQLSLLKTPSKTNIKEREEDLKRKAATLENTLLEFGVKAKVVKINRGPVITMYELEPAIGTKVNRITSLSDNISLALKSANIRIVAPLPGRGTIGIEVPNDKSEVVLLRDILETMEYSEEDSVLKLALGKDISGTPIITDLTKMPHLLIAGATGSGKTVCLNGIISSLLFSSSPDELKFLMVDPKRVELMMFEGIPHLVSPIVTNPKKAAAALNWVVNEMERRYEIFAEKGVRNISAYKQKRGEEEESLPYIIVIVDELADLMMVAQQDVEGAIIRIAQLSRAAGIHMILATQRPSVNVVTGVVKANFPARISFKVASKVDSRTVLDTNGAEKLLGRGDMLLMEPGETSIIRGQCSLVEDSEIRNMVKFIKSQAGAQYIEEAVENQEKKTMGVEQEKDELYKEAVKIVILTKQASVSMIQRKLRVGYTRAARMVDIMEEEGIVGPYNGSKPREILVEDIKTIEQMDQNDNS
ncbi:MAG: DNA translocase FtsK [Candidatus Omnitrophota bacterium]|nr:DNA translocase FtsK [Candidatus Omnitrophota bacterium]